MPNEYKKPCPNVLLVEGKNDYHVIKALSNLNHLPENFYIKDCGCNDKEERGEMIVGAIDPAILSPLHEVVGIVIDADKGYDDKDKEAFNNRWNQIKTILKKHQYTIPDKPSENGTIIEKIEDKPKIGIWMMPNNKTPGMLEDFIIELANEKGIDFSTKCVEEAKNIGEEVATYKDIHKSKAIVHTYLAWQDEPGLPMGLAITAHVLNHNATIANTFVQWLKDLFEI